MKKWRRKKTAIQNCVIRLLRFANGVPAMNIEHVNAYCHKSKQRFLCIHQCAYRYKQCHGENKNNIKPKRKKNIRMDWIHKPMWLQESVLFASTLSILYTVHTFEEEEKKTKFRYKRSAAYPYKYHAHTMRRSVLCAPCMRI